MKNSHPETHSQPRTSQRQPNVRRSALRPTPPESEPVVAATLKPAAVGHNYEFDGQKLTVLVRDGKPYFIAAEVGRMLGYADGSKLAEKICGEWSNEFIAGDDFVKVTGDDLVAINAAMFDPPESGGSKRGGIRREILLLTRDGINMALIKTRMPKGVEMRRWVVSTVLPSLQDGRLVAVADKAEVARAVRAEMDRQFRTPESKHDELMRLASEAATLLADSDASRVPGIVSWAIEAARGVACYGGTARDLSLCNMRQFKTMRVYLCSMRGFARLAPQSSRRASAHRLQLTNSTQGTLCFGAEHPDFSVTVQITPKSKKPVASK